MGDLTLSHESCSISLVRESINAATRSLAADEALEYAREAETLDDEIADIYRRFPENRAAIGRKNARLGICLKLAEVHANLAVAEEVRALRVDLTEVPVPGPTFTKGGVFDLAESVGVVREIGAE